MQVTVTRWTCPRCGKIHPADEQGCSCSPPDETFTMQDWHPFYQLPPVEESK